MCAPHTFSSGTKNRRESRGSIGEKAWYHCLSVFDSPLKNMPSKANARESIMEANVSGWAPNRHCIKYLGSA